MSSFNINVTSNDTEEISEETKKRFVNRNKNSSKCVSKQDEKPYTPNDLPTIFSIGQSKSTGGKKEISKSRRLSPIKNKKHAFFSPIRDTNSYLKADKDATKLKFTSNKGHLMDRILQECLKDNKDFEEAFETLKKHNLVEEEETNLKDKGDKIGDDDLGFIESKLSENTNDFKVVVTKKTSLTENFSNQMKTYYEIDDNNNTFNTNYTNTHHTNNHSSNNNNSDVTSDKKKENEVEEEYNEELHKEKIINKLNNMNSKDKDKEKHKEGKKEREGKEGHLKSNLEDSDSCKSDY